MAKFTYMGDHDQVTTWGVTFARGVPVEVDHPMLLQKLPGNSEFVAGAEQVATGGALKASEGLTAAQMRAALDEKGISYPAGANKATLAELLDTAE